MRIAALGAHPDDIEIFMGGTMLAWRAMGAELHFIIATDGSKGGKGDPARLAATRRAEAEASAALFGASLHWLGFPDSELAARAETVATVAGSLASCAPHLGVTHAPNDYHADHRALSEIVRHAAGFSIPVLFCDTLMGTGFTPTHYVDTSAFFDAKCEALLKHVSQAPARFVEWSRLQNAFRAAQCGQSKGAFAEAFRFEPVYPFADIRGLLPPPPRVRPVPVGNPIR